MNEIENKISLVFVYNADSGLFNTLTDIAHKVFSPDTYECNLCMITHDALSMRSDWKEFIEQLDIGLEFLHRDEFLKRYQMSNAKLPCIFSKNTVSKGNDTTSMGPDELSSFISADEVNACKSIDDLKGLIRGRLENMGGAN